MVSPQWFKSDQLLPSDTANFEDTAKVYPNCDGMVIAKTNTYADNNIYTSNANVINYMKSLDMNAFLLPAERSVMEWHDRDEV